MSVARYRWVWGTPQVVCIDDFSAVVMLQLDELAQLNFAVTPAGRPQPSMDDLFSQNVLSSSGAYITSGSLQVSLREAAAQCPTTPLALAG